MENLITAKLEKIEKMILAKFPDHQATFILNTIEEIIDSKAAEAYKDGYTDCEYDSRERDF